METAEGGWAWGPIRVHCLRVATRMLGNRHDAEEVVQEALTRAWRSQQTGRETQSPLAWCVAITRNEALRRLKRPTGHVTEVEFVDDLHGSAAASDGEELLILRLDVGAALKALPSGERRLLDLRYFCGMTQPEIAKALEIPEGTAKIRLHQARRRLRTIIDQGAP